MVWFIRLFLLSLLISLMASLVFSRSGQSDHSESSRDELSGFQVINAEEVYQHCRHAVRNHSDISVISFVGPDEVGGSPAHYISNDDSNDLGYWHWEIISLHETYIQRHWIGKIFDDATGTLEKIE